MTSRSTLAKAAALAAGAGALLAGCAGQSTGGSDFGQVSLAPGRTATCYTNPCAVVFALPPGTGSYAVRANNMLVGTYPAGQPANLGQFFRDDSPVTIKVDGTDAEPAILWITGSF